MGRSCTNWPPAHIVAPACAAGAFDNRRAKGGRVAGIAASPGFYRSGGAHGLLNSSKSGTLCAGGVGFYRQILPICRWLQRSVPAGSL